MQRTLYLDKAPLEEIGDKSCDGCAKLYEENELFLNGIESCCGGCYRSLCMDCVRWTYAEVQKEKMRKF